MAYAVGRISGGHFNPAVTVGAALGGRLPWSQTDIYIGTQLVAAISAGLSLFILLHGFEGYSSTEDGIGQNSFGDAGSGYAWWAAFLLEALLTLIFVLVILAVTDIRQEHPALAPLAIGLSLTMIHYASINATGTSVNPARSIGVGLFAGTDAIIQLWLFILAPTIGGRHGRPHLPHPVRPRRGAGGRLRTRRSAGCPRRPCRVRRPVRPVPAAVEPAGRRGADGSVATGRRAATGRPDPHSAARIGATEHPASGHASPGDARCSPAAVLAT